MKLETFFEKFDQFADAPDAVAKMRELVLNLAVKGKLTDRDLKKESVDSKYADETSSDVLPANWRLLNFGKFCDIQGGNQPPKSQFSDEPRPGYVRMFQIRDLGDRPVPVYISMESTNRFCREGEILIGRYGASVGKVFWAQDGA
jgi:type I restriction enzyme S subunit